MFMKPSFVSRLFSHVSQQSHEATAWLKRYARNPRNVGSILPSSKMLGRAMTSAALRYGARDALFIEAGAGNGAITRVLAQSLAGRNRLVACEFLPSFAQELQRRLVVGCRICRIGRRRAIKRLCRRCRFAVWRRTRRGISARFCKTSCTKTRARCWCSLPTG